MSLQIKESAKESEELKASINSEMSTQIKKEIDQIRHRLVYKDKAIKLQTLFQTITDCTVHNIRMLLIAHEQRLTIDAYLDWTQNKTFNRRRIGFRPVNVPTIPDHLVDQQKSFDATAARQHLTSTERDLIDNARNQIDKSIQDYRQFQLDCRQSTKIEFNGAISLEALLAAAYHAYRNFVHYVNALGTDKPRNVDAMDWENFEFDMKSPFDNRSFSTIDEMRNNSFVDWFLKSIRKYKTYLNPNRNILSSMDRDIEAKRKQIFGVYSIDSVENVKGFATGHEHLIELSEDINIIASSYSDIIFLNYFFDIFNKL